MSPEEIQGLIAQGESDRLEFTTSADNQDKYAKAICAFSNNLAGDGQSGYLFYGVKDDGSILGGEVTDQWQTNVAAIRDSGNILPQPAMSVEKVELEGKSIGVVKVEPHPSPPVRYKGTVYVRVGPRKAIASSAEERRLIEKSQAANTTFDKSPCWEAALDDIDLHFFQNTYLLASVSQDVISENDRPIEQRLASLSLWNTHYERPTIAGLLLSGKDPLKFFPGAYVQVVKYNSNFEPQLNKRFTGTLFTQLHALNSFFGSQSFTLLSGLNGFRDIESNGLPMRALRELIVNAVIHRDYQSHAAINIELHPEMLSIQSPGGLYGQATSQNFPRQNDYRNPILAQAMVNLGFANRFGSGIRVAKQDAEAHVLHASFFYDEPNYFRVELTPKPEEDE